MYKIIANGEDVQQSVVEIVADTLADISILPTKFVSPGSDCIVLENSSVWMLGNDEVWHEL